MSQGLQSYTHFACSRRSNTGRGTESNNEQSNNSCELESVPTWLLKTCIDELLPLMTALINKSLSTGTFPDLFLEAIIRPLLKKPNLDVDTLKSYRPVSNLYIGVEAHRKDSHGGHNHQRDDGITYKKHHSTETALLKISNNILCSRDIKQCTILAKCV